MWIKNTLIQTNTLFGHISKTCFFYSNKLFSQWHTTYFSYNGKIIKSETFTIVMSNCKVLLQFQCKVAYFIGSLYKLFFIVTSLSCNKQTGEQTPPYRLTYLLILGKPKTFKLGEKSHLIFLHTLRKMDNLHIYTKWLWKWIENRKVNNEYGVLFSV